VLIDFWTYTCINCIRTLPYLEAGSATTAKTACDRRIESPEFAFERARATCAARSAVRDHYPDRPDNNLATWTHGRTEYLPADYLIEASGRVRYATCEGDYGKTENAIRALLVAAGARRLGQPRSRHVIHPSLLATPRPTSAPSRRRLD